jgi:hypothetical protein
MATNSQLVLSSLDFDTLKENFKEFLKTQSVFLDYDFEGSNMNVLLDVMSYNTYLNAFYLNMVASEMFLDSAQKYDSVISHAKELNYLPRSAKSGVAKIDLSLDTNITSGVITIPKGTRFSGINANGTYVFTTDQSKVISSPNTTYDISNLLIYEGDYYTDTFIVDYSIENQQFIFSNKNIDINSLTLSVVEDNGATVNDFKRADTLYGLSSTSKVFFLQGSQEDSYELIFGNDLFGRRPKDGAVLNANYRISSGKESRGITEFTLSDDIGPINGGRILTSTTTTITASSAGTSKETMESIRFSAPRYFATQQRAVSSDDYSSLVLTNFGGDISDVVVYGGQEVKPKLYGRVIIAVKPTTGTVAADYIKTQIQKYLKNYIALPNRVLIVDPEYTFVKIFTEIQYNDNSTTKTADEIQTLVSKTITKYSNSSLEEFGKDLRYSALVADIDATDTSITSNDTELRIIKRITPLLNQKTTYNLDVGNVLYYDATGLAETTEQHKALHDSEIDLRYSHSTMMSSLFTYNAKDGNVYESSFFEDDSNGNVILYTYINNEIVPIETVGTIDYVEGLVVLKEINVADYTNHISLYFRSRFKDIYADKNNIIIIDPNDVEISVIETKRQ